LSDAGNTTPGSCYYFLYLYRVITWMPSRSDIGPRSVVYVIYPLHDISTYSPAFSMYPVSSSISTSGMTALVKLQFTW
jgi:hypothetical protein